MKIRIFCFSLLAVFLFSLFNITAWAQGGQNQKNWSITPRFWFASYEDLDPYEAGATFLESHESIEAPFYGLTVRFAPAALTRFDFILSGYYGEGNGGVSTLDANGATSQGNTEMNRTDVELLGRYHPAALKNGHLIFGLRWIQVENTLTLERPVRISPQSYDKSQIYFVELGAGFSAALSQDGRWVAFSNLVFGYGNNRNELQNRGDPDTTQNIAMGLLDVNIGLLWSFDLLNVHLRYRGVQIGTDFRFQDGVLIHGPEIGVSISF